MEREMTFQDLTTDPLIVMLMRADGVALEDLQNLKQMAEQRELSHLKCSLQKSRANDFYNRLEAASQKTYGQALS